MEEEEITRSRTSASKKKTSSTRKKTAAKKKTTSTAKKKKTTAGKKKTAASKKKKTATSASFRATNEEKALIRDYRKCNLIEKKFIRMITEKAAEGTGSTKALDTESITRMLQQ